MVGGDLLSTQISLASRARDGPSRKSNMLQKTTERAARTYLKWPDTDVQRARVLHSCPLADFRSFWPSGCRSETSVSAERLKGKDVSGGCDAWVELERVGDFDPQLATKVCRCRVASR